MNQVNAKLWSPFHVQVEPSSTNRPAPAPTKSPSHPSYRRSHQAWTHPHQHLPNPHPMFLQSSRSLAWGTKIWAQISHQNPIVSQKLLQRSNPKKSRHPLINYSSSPPIYLSSSKYSSTDFFSPLHNPLSSHQDPSRARGSKTHRVRQHRLPGEGIHRHPRGAGWGTKQLDGVAKSRSRRRGAAVVDRGSSSSWTPMRSRGTQGRGFVGGWRCRWLRILGSGWGTLVYILGKR
jgi:hypothetical protein